MPGSQLWTSRSDACWSYFRRSTSAVSFLRAHDVMVAYRLAMAKVRVRFPLGALPQYCFARPRATAALRRSPCWYGQAAVNRPDTGSIPVAAACSLQAVFHAAHDQRGASFARAVLSGYAGCGCSRVPSTGTVRKPWHRGEAQTFVTAGSNPTRATCCPVFVIGRPSRACRGA